MTVAELIAELAKWPPDLIVCCRYHTRDGDYYEDPVQEVQRTDEGLLVR